MRLGRLGLRRARNNARRWFCSGGIAQEELLRLFGTTEALPTLRELKTGSNALSIEIDAGSGAIGNIIYDGTEVFEGVGFVVRTEAWGTIPACMDDPVVTPVDRGFRVHHEGAAGPVKLSFSVEIWEEPEAGQCGVVIDVSASSIEDFNTARTGFVLLHSLGPTVGSPVQVSRVLDDDGDFSQESFPHLIDGQQPFTDITRLRYNVDSSGSAMVECELEDLLGQTGPFEMEDQRLWTDASFKTYVRPLHWQWPYPLVPDQQIRQRVKLTFSKGGMDGDNSGFTTTSKVAAPTTPADDVEFPAVGVGVCVSTIASPGTEKSVGRAIADAAGGGKAVLVCHLHSDAAQEGQIDEIAKAAQVYHRLGELCDTEVMVEAVVGMGTDSSMADDSVAQLAAVLKSSPLLNRVTALSLTPDVYLGTSAVDDIFLPQGAAQPLVPAPALLSLHRTAHELLGGCVALGAAAGLTNFCELARRGSRPLDEQSAPADSGESSGGCRNSAAAGAGYEAVLSQGLVEFIAHSNCAIVHDASDRAVMRTARALSHVASSALALQPSREYHYRVLPSSIGLRFNPWGADVSNNDGVRKPMVHADPRQRGLFGAVFAVATIGNYLQSPARAVPRLLSLSELTGPRGMVAATGDAEDDFILHPLYHVVRDSAASKGMPVVPLTLVSADSAPAVSVVGGVVVTVEAPNASDTISGFAVESAGRKQITLANLTPKPQQLQISTHPPKAHSTFKLTLLDSDTYEAAACDTGFVQSKSKLVQVDSGVVSLKLKPHAVVWIKY